jgi:hypothetical protein
MSYLFTLPKRVWPELLSREIQAALLPPDGLQRSVQHRYGLADHRRG